ncbi:MAG: carboxypeptidase regulatory-like domain-containing protein [Gemmatimonadales bacterium]
MSRQGLTAGLVRLAGFVLRAGLACAWIGLNAGSAFAQGGAVLRGNVLNDATDAPIGAAQVSIPSLGITVLSDSTGAFRMVGVPPGLQIVWVRRVGFSPVSAVLRFAAGDTLERDFAMLRNAQALPEVDVKAAAPAPPKLSEFEERRKEGMGRFITREFLEKNENHRMSDIMATIPGPRILQGKTNAAWIWGGRGKISILRGSSGLDIMDVAKGAKSGLCYSAVVLDGTYVYQGNEGETLFDINSIEPSSVAGIEVYTSTATMPAKYNGTKNTCGLVLIWTR